MPTTQTRESLSLLPTPATRGQGGCDGSCGCGGGGPLKTSLGRLTVVAVTALIGVYAVTAWATGSACLGLCHLIP